jgi:hypothetical protein
MSTGENSSIKPPVSPIVMFGLRRPNGSRLYFRLARVWTSVRVVPASDSSLLVVLGPCRGSIVDREICITVSLSYLEAIRCLHTGQLKRSMLRVTF